MKTQVYFIGAGPGDPDLITVKGRRLVESADLVLYAGSLVPAEVVACARKDARVENSASMNLEQTHALMMETVRQGGVCARVHTGDPSIYGAILEQMELLEAEGVRCETVPGVTAAFAASAASRRPFTVPEVTQTLIISRLEGRTPVPEREHLRELAKHGSAMCIYLSAGNPDGVQSALLEGAYGPETLIVAARRVGWPDEHVVETTLGKLAETARENGFDRQTVFLVLPGQAPGETRAKSLLYDAGFAHMYRD